MDSLKCCVDHDTPFDYPIREEVAEIPGRILIDLDGMDDIIISEKISRAIGGECEFALVGSETDSNYEPKSKLIIVDGGCTTSLTSFFEICADCKPRITRGHNANHSRVYEILSCSIQDRRNSSDYNKSFHMPDAENRSIICKRPEFPRIQHRTSS